MWWSRDWLQSTVPVLVFPLWPRMCITQVLGRIAGALAKRRNRCPSSFADRKLGYGDIRSPYEYFNSKSASPRKC